MWWWLGCSGPEPKDGPDDTGEPVDPLAYYQSAGPYRAGWTELSASWQDPLLPAARELRVNVWYPTEDEDGGPVVYSGVFPDDAALGDAAVIDGALPVVVFSHGHQGFGGNSSFLMRHLASHGWLVVAPDHTDNTTFDGSDRTTEIYWERPLDLRAALDVARGSFSTTDELGAVGHSFGGYTMHAVGGAAYALDTLVPACLDGTDTSDFCSTLDDGQAAKLGSDLTLPGVRSVVAMAPGDFRLFEADGIGQMDVPELLLTGGLDPSTATDGDRVWEALPEGRLGVNIPTMGHQGFTDFSGTLGDPPGSIEPAEGYAIVNTAVAAFLDLTVRGVDRGRGLLDGTSPLSELAEVREP